MVVAAADLVFYASLNMPENETSAYGGAIDATTRVTFADVTTPPKRLKIRTASDDVDMRGKLVTLKTRKADGVEETFASVALDGSDSSTPVDIDGANTKQSLQSAVYDAAQTPATPDVDIIVEDDSAVEVARIYAGEMGVTRLFRQAYSEASGAKNYHEKIFAKNNNGSDALLEAQIIESSDPAVSDVTFLLSDSKDDSDPTVANRLTAPNAIYTQDPDTFDSTTKNVPTGSLAAGETIGVYVKMPLSTSQAPQETSYTLQLSGKTA